MPDLVKEYKDLDKTSEDLLLEKTNITDTEGELTSEGIKLLMQLLAKDNRVKLVGAATEIDTARNKAAASPVSVVDLQDLENRVTDLEDN